MSDPFFSKIFIEKKTFWEKFIGLMGRKRISKDVVYVFYSCKQVHTFFMKFPIIVIYLDEFNNIIWFGKLNPWKIAPFMKESNKVLELADEDILHVLKVGDTIQSRLLSNNDSETEDN